MRQFQEMKWHSGFRQSRGHTLNKLDVGKFDTISYIYLCDGCLYDSDYYFKCMDYKSNRKKGCRSNDTGGIRWRS